MGDGDRIRLGFTRVPREPGGGGSSVGILGDSRASPEPVGDNTLVPRDDGRDRSLYIWGVGDVIFLPLSLEDPGLAEALGSAGNRILEVSKTNATVDSSFPATVVDDSPPRTIILSRLVVKVCPQRALGPAPIPWNENHRRAKQLERYKGWTYS
jgi:hypothetical protein